MNHYKFIAYIITLTSAIFLLMWINYDGAISDFGLNGFTETIGIGITVFIIDYFMQKREEQRLLPQRRASHEDVKLLVSKMTSFWLSTFISSVPENPPSTMEEFFTKNNIDKIRYYLDMDSIPNVTPRTNWWSYLPHQLKDFKKLSETILERHNNTLDPIAYYAVHKIMKSILDPDLIQATIISDQEYNFKRAKNLGNYLFILDDYFEAIKDLINWCNLEAGIIGKLSKIPPDKIDINIPTINVEYPPACMYKW